MLSPLQIELVPLTTLVGLGLTVTIALPVISAATAEHLRSLKAVSEYVVVNEGVTANV